MDLYYEDIKYESCKILTIIISFILLPNKRKLIAIFVIANSIVIFIIMFILEMGFIRALSYATDIKIIVIMILIIYH